MFLKTKDFTACNNMDNKVASHARYAVTGRKYLNHQERSRLICGAAQLSENKRLFIEVLCWTGARISELLALTPHAFDVPASVLTLRTLKRRKLSFRDVPIPPELMQRLDRHFAITAAQRAPLTGHLRLWPFSRSTGWRLVKDLAASAGIFGARATPRGFRHGFGHGSTCAGVPMTILQRWLGHAHIKSTAVYLEFVGPDDFEFARRFWAYEPLGAATPGLKGAPSR
jgi:integrase/recombinase XerD